MGFDGLRSDDRRPGPGGHPDRAVPCGTFGFYQIALIQGWVELLRYPSSAVPDAPPRDGFRQRSTHPTKGAYAGCLTLAVRYFFTRSAVSTTLGSYSGASSSCSRSLRPEFL